MIGNLSIFDNLLILVYFVSILGIGFIYSRKRDGSSEDYFLAGRNVGWLALGASMFATNISSEHIVGLAGAGSTRGFSVGQFEWLAVIFIILLAWVFAPIFLRSNVYTMPQFFGMRFDNKCRIYLTTVSIGSYFFTKIAVTLLAGGFILNGVLGWDMFTSAVLIVLVTGIYTVMGGLASVIRTQLYQALLLIFGSLLLTIFGIIEIGGFSELFNKLPSEYFTLFKPSTDQDFPWTGILFGAPILAIWYWCTDQYIVQRVLAAKGIKEVKKGALLASALKVFPIFLLIFPGLIAVVLYPEMKGDKAITYLLTGNLLPAGIKGIVIIGVFAALMSSLSSAFNSAATLFTLDYYKMWKPRATEQELVLIGRLSTTLIVFLAILVIPLLKTLSSHIYIYLQNVQAYISPPIACVFLLGIFWKKASAKSAIYALLVGGVLGLLKIITGVLSTSLLESIPVLNYYDNINYLHFASYLFLLSAFIMVAVTYSEKRKTEEELSGTLNYTFNPSDFGFRLGTKTYSKVTYDKKEIEV